MNGRPRFALHRAARAAASASTLADDARAGLRSTPRSIPPKHFYDDRGSDLFDRICELPEYYLTRAEHALLQRHASEIVGASRAHALVELGSGMARKTRALAEALCRTSPAPLYVPFDISEDAIAASAAPILARFPRLDVRGIVGEFPRDLDRVARAAPPRADRPRLFAFLGSTLGNLDRDAAPAFLRALSAVMTGSDELLLGVDLLKDERVLHAAYNDAAGITARFNKNVLTVMNRALAADFDEDAFAHDAVFNPDEERIEMHLVSLRDQRVTVAALGLTCDFAKGERLLTEISRKFTRASIADTLARGNLRQKAWYEGPEPAFGLIVARRDD